MSIAMPEKATAAIISTISEEAPIRRLVWYEYSNYALKSNMTLINVEVAKYHLKITLSIAAIFYP